MERMILFWVFVTFFVAIGILSLLVAMGAIKADPRFRRWCVGGFIAAVTGAVIGVFNLSMNERIPIFVTLTPPEGVEPPLNLVTGRYEYDMAVDAAEVITQSGRVELTMGHGGGWVAKLPQEVLDRPVTLKFKDHEGGWWGTPPFYPNYTAQSVGRTSPPILAARPRVRSEPRAGLALAAGPAPPSSGQRDEKPPSHVLVAGAAPRFDNYSRLEGEFNKRTYYRWRIFVDEPSDVLERIEEVQYMLHPTFPKPYQVRKNPETRFALETTGWGEFRILITIRYKNGRVAKTSYHLNLDKPWPAKEE